MFAALTARETRWCAMQISAGTQYVYMIDNIHANVKCLNNWGISNLCIEMFSFMRIALPAILMNKMPLRQTKKYFFQLWKYQMNCLYLTNDKTGKGRNGIVRKFVRVKQKSRQKIDIHGIGFWRRQYWEFLPCISIVKHEQNTGQIAYFFTWNFRRFFTCFFELKIHEKCDEFFPAFWARNVWKCLNWQNVPVSWHNT